MPSSTLPLFHFSSFLPFLCSSLGSSLFSLVLVSSRIRKPHPPRSIDDKLFRGTHGIEVVCPWMDLMLPPSVKTLVHLRVGNGHDVIETCCSAKGKKKWVRIKHGPQETSWELPFIDISLDLISSHSNHYPFFILLLYTYLVYHKYILCISYNLSMNLYIYSTHYSSPKQALVFFAVPKDGQQAFFTLLNLEMANLLQSDRDIIAEHPLDTFRVPFTPGSDDGHRRHHQRDTIHREQMKCFTVKPVGRIRWDPIR